MLSSLPLASDAFTIPFYPGNIPILRVACPKCKQHFCVDCDIYIHESLHNCPGCESFKDSKPTEKTIGWCVLLAGVGLVSASIPKWIFTRKQLLGCICLVMDQGPFSKHNVPHSCLGVLVGHCCSSWQLWKCFKQRRGMMLKLFGSS